MFLLVDYVRCGVLLSFVVLNIATLCVCVCVCVYVCARTRVCVCIASA